MKKIRKILAVVVLVVLVGTGCRGVNLLDMNRELSSLHAQRVAMNAELTSAQKAGDKTEEFRNSELMLADIDNNLIALAAHAQKAAEKAGEDGHDLDAIAFCRIGAVAALLSEAPNLAVLTKYGSAKCDKQGNGIAAAPRDCAMLKTIDYLAINAKCAPELKKIAAEEKALKQLRTNLEAWIAKIKETGIRDRTKEIFNALLNASEQIAKIYGIINSPEVPVGDRFKKVIGLRAFTVACNARYALDILESLTLPKDFDDSKIPQTLKPEMEQWSRELKAAEKLKTDLDRTLITEANFTNCKSQ